MPIYSVFNLAHSLNIKSFILLLLLIFVLNDSRADKNNLINCPPAVEKLGLMLNTKSPRPINLPAVVLQTSSPANKTVGKFMFDESHTLQPGGCQIKRIVPLSPAWFSPLRSGDWIIAINNSRLTEQNQNCQRLKKEIQQAIKNKHSIQLEVSSSSSGININMPVLLTSPLMNNEVLSSSDTLFPSSAAENLPILAQLQIELMQHYLKENKLDYLKPDPLTTLACLTNSAPAIVLPVIKQIQQQPMQLKSIMELIQQQLSPSRGSDFSLAAFANTVHAFSYAVEPIKGRSQMAKIPNLTNNGQIMPFDSDPSLVLKQLTAFLKAAHQLSAAAFSQISSQQRDFFLHNFDQLSATIEHSQTLLNETNRQDLETIVQLFNIAGKVNYKQLSTAAGYWFQLTEKNWLKQLSDAQQSFFSNHKKTITTPYGTIVLGSYGDDVHIVNQQQQAIIIDPGGNDQYIMATEKKITMDKPVINTAIIDLAGDDTYLSSQNKGFASAILGISLLIDVQGDDDYQGNSWAQGSAFAGIAALYDLAGDDQYAAHSFSQAAALFGSAMLVDNTGNDSYHIKHHGQGLGLPYGHGVLMDSNGNDHYLSSNGLISSYQGSASKVSNKTPVTTESWSQGCGKGFRLVLPGGIGILLDVRGDDTFSAHEFAQGSGYYYAMGLLYNLGKGNDHYQGTRYNTAASAHQAIGALFDAAGNDHYTTSGPAFCAGAWDQSISLFHDQAGDDHYISRDFSLAAAAHNSIASFWDVSGNDQFTSSANPAHISSNDYHGGKSLSYFFSAGNKIMSRINQHKQEFVISCKQPDGDIHQSTILHKDAILCH